MRLSFWYIEALLHSKACCLPLWPGPPERERLKRKPDLKLGAC